MKSTLTKNLSSTWTKIQSSLRKSTKVKLFFQKSPSISTDAIGPLMSPKAPESLTNKFSKTLVKKFLIICTMAIMLLFLLTVKQVLVSRAQFRVFPTLSLKDFFNCVSKMFLDASSKTNPKELQQL